MSDDRRHGIYFGIDLDIENDIVLTTKFRTIVLRPARESNEVLIHIRYAQNGDL